jgi:predicted dienelactone hydrolase
MLRQLIAILISACAFHAAAQTPSYVFAAGFENAMQPWGGQANLTVVVRNNLSITDPATGRAIPLLVRYPAELVAAGPPLPVVVWSHGGSADPDGRLGSREWSETLVRAGFVVVHFSLLARDAAARQALYAEFGMTPAQGQACLLNPVHVDRPRDASAVIGRLCARQRPGRRVVLQ